MIVEQFFWSSPPCGSSCFFFFLFFFLRSLICMQASIRVSSCMSSFSASISFLKGEMDRESRKRGREDPVVVLVAATEEENEVVLEGVATAEMTMKKGKKQETSAPSTDVVFEAGDVFEISDVYRPPGLFEFPWQEEENGGLLTAAVAAESDGRDLRDVFFSSLVDGCSAAIGFPGDRLSPPPGPIALPGDDDDESWPSDCDDDGVDCIWTTVLRQPLTTVYSKRTSA